MRIALNVLQQGPLPEGPEWWTLADRAGVDVIGLPDSPALVRELYVVAALCAEHTSRARIMTSVTNPLSRDPSVTASCLLTLEEIAPGRIACGIGTGDSALWGVGLRPATVAQLRDYIVAVKALLRGEEGPLPGQEVPHAVVRPARRCRHPGGRPRLGTQGAADGLRGLRRDAAADGLRAGQRGLRAPPGRGGMRGRGPRSERASSCGGTPRSSSATAPRRPSAAAWA